MTPRCHFLWGFLLCVIYTSIMPAHCFLIRAHQQRCWLFQSQLCPVTLFPSLCHLLGPIPRKVHACPRQAPVLGSRLRVAAQARPVERQPCCLCSGQEGPSELGVGTASPSPRVWPQHLAPMSDRNLHRLHSECQGRSRWGRKPMGCWDGVTEFQRTHLLSLMECRLVYLSAAKMEKRDKKGRSHVGGWRPSLQTQTCFKDLATARSAPSSLPGMSVSTHGHCETYGMESR